MDCVPPCISCNSFPNTTEDETMIFNTTNSDKYMVVVKVFIVNPCLITESSFFYCYFYYCYNIYLYVCFYRQNVYASLYIAGSYAYVWFVFSASKNNKKAEIIFSTAINKFGL